MYATRRHILWSASNKTKVSKLKNGFVDVNSNDKSPINVTGQDNHW